MLPSIIPRHALSAMLALTLSLTLDGVGGPVAAQPVGRHRAATPVAPRLPPPDAQEQLLQAHHLRWVSGDIAGARRILQRLVDSSATRGALRAVAALRLAELAERAGERRRALVLLDQAKALAGPGNGLALEADDRRARILTAAPLADVRGPIPGAATVKGEAAPVVTTFREAERLLVVYHRIVVAPSLENVNEVLRTKRQALGAAVAAYGRAAAVGASAARAAAQFRTAAMYHHLAEALAFESPSELLPSVARVLRRQLRAESAGYLRRALTHYLAALKEPPSAATAPWQAPARREAELLELVLKTSKKPR